MEVRRLHSGDAELARQTITTLKITDGRLRRDLNADYLRRFLARQENYLIVATLDAQPIGYIVAYLLDRIDRGQTMMFFYEISVADSHQRRGVGTAMIELLKSYCRQQNVLKMWVQTHRSNVAAVGLYQSTGAVAEPAGDEITFGWYSAESFGTPVA